MHLCIPVFLKLFLIAYLVGYIISLITFSLEMISKTSLIKAMKADILFTYVRIVFIASYKIGYP